MRLRKVLTEVLLGAAQSCVVACGSSSPNVVPGGGGSDAAMADGAGGVAANDAQAGALTGDALCQSMARSDCQMCCNSLHPDAGQIFFADALVCACAAASLCGPAGADDGSADAADPTGDGAAATSTGASDGGGSGLGSGACSADMCSQRAVRSDACTQCVSLTLQSSSGIGACAIGASGSCSQDPTCAPIVSCAILCK